MKRMYSIYSAAQDLIRCVIFFDCLGAVVVTAPAASSTESKRMPCAESVPTIADKERSVPEGVEENLEQTRIWQEISVGMCSESCCDKRELEH